MKKNYLSRLAMVMVVALLAVITVADTSCKKKKEIKHPYEVVLVEGGTFWMGAQSTDPAGQNYDPLAWSNEGPVHQVTVKDFYIGKFEVSQAQWKEVMDKQPSYFINNYPTKLPVENISFDDVTRFIEKLNEITGKTYRLPTEAEWEYAARGGQKALADGSFYTNRYSGSDRVAEVAWFEGSITDPINVGNGMNTTHHIGELMPNQLGIYDMSGNVREWCSDLYRERYDETEIVGPLRVTRGGCWNYLDRGCRNTARYNTSNNPDFTLGLRLVLEK